RPRPQRRGRLRRQSGLSQRSQHLSAAARRYRVDRHGAVRLAPLESDAAIDDHRQHAVARLGGDDRVLAGRRSDGHGDRSLHLLGHARRRDGGDGGGIAGGAGGMMADSLRLGLDRWRAWQRQFVHRRIFGVTVTVGALIVAVKLLAILKEAVVAHQFGTGDALEAFLIAMVLPQFAINLVGGSLNAALIPTYIHVREHDGPEAAHRLFASVTALSLTILIALSLILGIAAPVILPLVASGFPDWKLDMA